jgi:nodulation protein E
LKVRDLKVNVGCSIVDYPEDDGIDKRQSLTMSAISRISVIAARQAMQHSGSRNR